MPGEISEITRRAIMDVLSLSSAGWAGRLPEDDFLARLYNLADMPSTDRRLRDAAADVWQHRINWQDWTDDWVFYDSRFNLLGCPDVEFLRFLCETVHPVVRPESSDARDLVASYNAALAPDGWRLAEAGELSGRPLYRAQRLGDSIQVFPEATGWRKADRQMQEARFRLDTAESEEEYQAVGLICREALISVAQEVYSLASHPTEDGAIPSPTDAKRMLDAVLLAELRGSGDEARTHAKAALRLANALQHCRTADFRMAALCAEATSSVINILAILKGRRGKI